MAANAANPATEQPDIGITDVPSRRRFEARTGDGELVGVSYYRREGDAVVFTHTEVDDAYEGAGIGSRLARVALDQVRGEGLTVDPQCPFVRSWIESHEDYQDLVA